MSCNIGKRSGSLLWHVNQTEVASYLGDFTLATDTAAGALALQKLAEQHHCGATLTVAPYEGLRKVRTGEGSPPC